MEKNLIGFIKTMQDKNITFWNKDFIDIDYNQFSNDVFLYFDPPYLVSTGNYNDGNRGFKNWTINEEKQLYHTLTKLDNIGLKWGLSNVIMNNGKENAHLINYINRNNYRVYEINSDYSNSSYQKKDKTKNKEVYLTNI